MLRKTLIVSIVFVVLTFITQVGGLVWLIAIYLFRKTSGVLKLTTRFAQVAILLLYFIVLYGFICFGIVPHIAKRLGRVPLPINAQSGLRPHTKFTWLCNRYYVTSELYELIIRSTQKMNKKYPTTEILYLDACFPFVKGFPLMPHLSHNDGKKIDFSFCYIDPDGQPINDNPANSGYGVFEAPHSGELNKTLECKKQEYQWYDYPKFLTFGSKQGYQLDSERTRYFIRLLLKEDLTQKLMIEPHLKTRMGLNSYSKIRFQGCGSVRHDDHIHFQIR